jgi:hypothetical protein
MVIGRGSIQEDILRKDKMVGYKLNPPFVFYVILRNYSLPKMIPRA